MNDNTKLRDEIKKAIRRNPRLNQKIVAAEVGCSPGYISLLLNGKKKGDSTLLAKIASIAGIKKISVAGFEIQSDLGMRAGSGAELNPPDEETAERLAKAREVMESGTQWGKLLSYTIDSSHEGLSIDRDNGAGKSSK